MNDRDRELDEEIAQHLRMAIEERVARGESREAAEEAARREFGNVAHVKEVTREQRGGLWLERLVQDVRYGARALRRTPAFTITAVLTLALAIGANSAVFTVVNSVLLRPLPFGEPDRLVSVSHMPSDLPFDVPPGLADKQWVEYRDRQRTLARATAYSRAALTLESGTGDAIRVASGVVDADFFPTLGVAPAEGRAFTPEETVKGRDRVVVLGDRLWRDRFGGNPRVVGSTISLDGNPYTVVGIAPPGFGFPAGSDLWTPLAITIDPNNSLLLAVIGRLRDGASPAQARAELDAIVRALPADPDADRHPATSAVVPLKELLTNKVHASLLVFSGAVGFVLLIACVNVANLLLIRAASRRRELAVRVALGASRLRIARQMLTESLLISLAGGAVGVVVARVGVRALVAIAPAGRIPRLDEVHLDGWVLGFTIALSVVTGLAFGMLPAVHAARRPPHEAMVQGARSVTRGQGRLRGVLVAAEVALALVLLTGAGLMIRSFVNIRHADKGYDGSRVMTMAVDLPRTKYANAQQLRAFHQELMAKLANIHGVRAVGGITWRPMGDVGMMGNFAVEGASAFPKGYSVDKTLVTPGYFATMGMRLLRGRAFVASDDKSAPGVVIVSQSIARRIWPGQDAVGKRVAMNSQNPAPDEWLTVVGVVDDVVQDGSMGKRSTMYFPYQQNDWSFILSHMTYVLRSDAGPSIAPAMRAALREVDPAVPAQALMSMDDALMEVVAEPVFQTRLLTVFAALALVLAAVGTYGVLAYDVTERSREIALRMALGATPGNVIAMVLRRTGTLAAVGAAIGVLGSLAVTGVLGKTLYEVRPNDPLTIAAVVTTILIVALLAGFAPARRAARTNVLTALPAE